MQLLKLADGRVIAVKEEAMHEMAREELVQRLMAAKSEVGLLESLLDNTRAALPAPTPEPVPQPAEPAPQDQTPPPAPQDPETPQPPAQPADPNTVTSLT